MDEMITFSNYLDVTRQLNLLCLELVPPWWV